MEATIRVGRRVAFVGTLLGMIGCAPGLSRGGVEVGPGSAPVELNVVNSYNSPMAIYAVGSGTSYRMGTVLPGLSARFVLRQAMVLGGPVEFFAQPSTRAAPVRSDRLLLAPGNVVDFRIGVDLLNSVASVRQ